MTKLFTARPTIYNGINMRSRLEAKTAGSLDEHGVAWTYEPRAYAYQNVQYLPDFEITEWCGGSAFLEVRGMEDFGGVYLAAQQMQVIWSSVPSAYLYLDVHSPQGFLRMIGYLADGYAHWYPHTNQDPSAGQLFCMGQCEPCIARGDAEG